jgi:UDP-N-acetylmuramyl-tripeptide synthetase
MPTKIIAPNKTLTVEKLLPSFKDAPNFIRFKDIKITGVELDSRLIEKNEIFFAIKGFKVDGAKFIPNVIKKGVKVIICEESSNIEQYKSEDILILKSDNIKKVLGKILKKLYPNEIKIVGVTGTNGKTTVAEVSRQAIAQLGFNTGTIGSLGVTYRVGEKEFHIAYEHDLTNPSLVDFYKYKSILNSKGVKYLIIEATSQGMRNGRLENVKLEAGIFTNITQDHIGDSPELHKDMADYFNWKTFLFRNLVKKSGYAIINADIPEFKILKAIAEKSEQKILDYGFNAKEIKITKIEPNTTGQVVEIEFFGKTTLKLETNFIGKFQASNIACIIGILIALGFKNRLREIDFTKLRAPKGRAELMGVLPNGAKVYMDYPTTEDALRNCIATFKDYQKAIKGGRVIILFGAGGDRDMIKRPKMGKVATDLADLAIITEDSPRTENPAKIREDIMAGCDKSKAVNIGNNKEGETIEGRTRAVKYAMSILEKNDILVTNKGHERHITIGYEDIHYDEEKLLKKLILEQGGKII